jgi:hypothetical protein
LGGFPWVTQGLPRGYPWGTLGRVTLPGGGLPGGFSPGYPEVTPCFPGVTPTEGKPSWLGLPWGYLGFSPGLPPDFPRVTPRLGNPRPAGVTPGSLEVSPPPPPPAALQGPCCTRRQAPRLCGAAPGGRQVPVRSRRAELCNVAAASWLDHPTPSHAKLPAGHPPYWPPGAALG